jgi:WD40 repeat protein/serine/threonine protein kinase
MSQSENDPHAMDERKAMRWAETSAPPPREVPAISDGDAGGPMPAQHEYLSTEDASLARGSDDPVLRPSDTAPALAPGGRIGQYEIIRLLGRGGMGEVHMARDLRLGRLVAIKLLTTQRPNLGERFLAEARATARCHHENIVVIHEVGEPGDQLGHPYMVLEYIEGQTLRQWMRERAAVASTGQRVLVPPGRAVGLMLPVVRALAYAHEQGIVHRDLKPENVMLTRAGVIKVLDFGIAKLLAAPASDGEAAGAVAGLAGVHSSSLIGTLPYMSPEQMKLGAIDQRTDVWAAGIMLFELVAGAHPVLDASSSAAAALLAMADEDTPMPSVRERVPELGPLAAVIDRCLIKNPAHRTPSARVLMDELEALAPGRRTVLVGDDGNPFAGLAAFQEADADRFFGRDRDIDHIVTELRSRPLVAVVGPSGAGKSSLVRAGVIPALRRAGEGWDAFVVRPGREPLAALAAMLGALAQRQGSSSESGQLDGTSGGVLVDSAESAALGPLASSLIARLRVEPGYLGARLRARATSKLRRVLVFVDQLEELYTQGAPADDRAAFLACLGAMADDAASPLRVLVSMRSDFLDRLTEDRRLGAEVTRGLVLLPPMDRDGMREALLRPVLASEHRFEPPELVDRMVDALAATPGALPLLQFTATRLWERRDRERRLLTEASYDELGGVAGALATHADAVLAGMSPAQQALARAVLERLVTPERTRALVSVAELRAPHRDSDLVDEVVQHLAAMRLVVIERSAEGAERTVELVHESLIDRWPTFVRWLDENQDDASMLARLRGAARDWERGGRAAGLLWTGEAADEVRIWQQRYRGELAPAEKRYLDAVLAAAERTRYVRRRLFGGILLAAVMVAVAMAWLAWQQTRARREAAQEAAWARDATRMAAMRALSSDPTTQLALLREIEDTSGPPPGAAQEAKRLLHAGVAPTVLTGHEGIIISAAFSPDGRRIVSTSRDRTARVWNADGSGEPLVLRHDDMVMSAGFSPDVRYLVTGSWDRTVRVWKADGSDAPLVLRGHDDAVTSAEFSPDGQRIVSASLDRTVRVWNADGSGEPLVLRGHDDAVTSARFSPDGQRIVSASRDRTVRVWNADGSGEPLALRGHDELVMSAAFSPDGQRIVSASWDTTVRVWNADGSGEPLVLRGHDGVVMSAGFSPDGQRIVSGSSDKTVRVWNADGSGEPLVQRGHDDAVMTAAFSPSGRHILSASFDKTLRVWDRDGSNEPLVLRGHDGAVMSAGFSPDGRHIVSASSDKTVRVRSADGSGEPLVLRGHGDVVWSAAFSPDGRRLVTGSWDRTVRVWNADGSGEPLVLRGHDDVVWSAAFSPDGQRIVSASRDRTVRVWNADGSGEPLVLRGHEDMVWSAVFSPDGRRIVSGSSDTTVRVWRADGNGEPLVLRGHGDTVRGAAFSPDGQRIVSASADTTVRVWRADGSGEPLVLRGPDDVPGAEFSPDGRYIVATSRDKTIRIWRADGTGEPVVLAGHDLWVNKARFSPDGRRIVSASDDGTVRVWHDLAPAALDDPRLWTATTYCMPIELRRALLRSSEQMARRDRQRCLERVEQARRASAAPATQPR